MTPESHLSPPSPGLLARPFLAVEVRIAWAFALAGMALRFVRLDGQSFWYDEAVSAELSQHSAWEILTGRARDLGNPPLHSLLLHFWSQAFGTSDTALRALSALAGALCVPVLYAAGRRLAGERRAALAAALFALAPFQVLLAQEARTFALLTLLGLLSVHQLQRAIEEPRALRFWAGWAFATAGALYAHYYAFFLLPAEALWILVQPGAGRRVRLSFLVALAGVALLYLPWVPAFLQQLGAKGNLARSPETWWLHALATPMAYTVGVTLVWKDQPGALRLALAGLATLAAAGAFLAGVLQLRREGRSRPILLWAGIPVLLPLAFSVLASPLYNVRYVAFAAPPFYLGVAAGLVALRPWLRRASALLLCAGALVSLGRYFTLTVKHDWRSTAAWVEARAAAEDLILFDADFTETAYAHYARLPADRLRLLPPPPGAPAGSLYGVARPREPVREVTQEIAGRQRVWLVLADADPPSRAALERFFAQGWRRSSDSRFVGIELQLWERPAALHAP